MYKQFVFYKNDFSTEFLFSFLTNSVTPSRCFSANGLVHVQNIVQAIDTTYKGYRRRILSP